MSLLILVFWLSLFLAFGWFALRRLMSYLHIFQQEEYDGGRFVPWLVRTGSVDRKLTLAVILIVAVRLFVAGPIASRVALLVAFVVFALLEKDPRKRAKKRLVLTTRARRILVLAFGLAIVEAAIVSLLLPQFVILWLLPIQLIPLNLVLGNLMAQPIEARVQRGFWQEAHDKLGALKPTVIGITGSFGKTSAKHILGHVLELHAPTLLTPGSVNTPMGIARVVREQLTGQHRYFVCEMGAYGPGSIERLCRLAPPDIAVITAVGYAHYERFKSLDTVAQTKLELAEAVAARGGRIVLAQPILQFEAARAFVARHGALTTVVGAGEGADLTVLAIRQTAEGLEVDIAWQGEQYTIRAPLFGEHHGMNAALSFAAAAVMGVPIENILLALRTTPQIKHRLEVKHEPSGAVLIDDAYNSNPVGFAGALAVLDLFRTPAGRRILVTPGMVELGAAHEAEHARIGALAGAHVDVLLPVLPARIEGMIAAYRAANPAGVVQPCDSFALAQAWLRANAGMGDVVLLENDLPDLYEAKLSL